MLSGTGANFCHFGSVFCLREADFSDRLALPFVWLIFVRAQLIFVIFSALAANRPFALEVRVERRACGRQTDGHMHSSLHFFLPNKVGSGKVLIFLKGG